MDAAEKRAMQRGFLYWDAQIKTYYRFKNEAFQIGDLALAEAYGELIEQCAALRNFYRTDESQPRQRWQPRVVT